MNQGTKQKRSRPEQVELLGNAAARFLGDPAEPFEQALDAVTDGHGGMPAAAADFGAADAFDLEAGQQLAFLLRKPSPVLAVVEKLEREGWPRAFRRGLPGLHRAGRQLESARPAGPDAIRESPSGRRCGASCGR